MGPLLDDAPLAVVNVIRAVLGWNVQGKNLVDFPSVAPSSSTWGEVLSTLTLHHLTGLASAAAAAGDLIITPTQAIELRQRNHQLPLRSLALTKVLLDASRTLTTADIPFLVTKGMATVALLYEHPSFRPCNDIDLLVSSENFSSAIAALVEAGGHRNREEVATAFDQRFTKEVVITLDAVIDIDLHRGLAVGPYGPLVDTSDLFNDTASFTVNGQSFDAPSFAGLFVHACFHLLHEFCALSTIRDMAEILYRYPDSLPRAELLASSWKSEAVLTSGLAEFARWLPLPDDVDLPGHRPGIHDRVFLRCYSDHFQPHLAIISQVATIRSLRERAAFLNGCLRPNSQYLAAQGLTRYDHASRAARSLLVGRRGSSWLSRSSRNADGPE